MCGWRIAVVEVACYTYLPNPNMENSCQPSVCFTELLSRCSGKNIRHRTFMLCMLKHEVLINIQTLEVMKVLYPGGQWLWCLNGLMNIAEN
jgi:hypothetical protein